MKFLSIFLFLTITLVSCNNPKKENMPVNANEKLVIQYFDHFNKHEWIAMANMYIETAEFKDPSLGNGTVKQTRNETIQKYSKLNAIFLDLHDKIIKIYPSGEKHVIVEFVSSGTAPDESRFELPICTIFTIENGKITKDYTYYDNFEESETEKP